MYFFLNPVYWCDVRNASMADRYCRSCMRSVSKANYKNVYVVSDKIKHALDLPSAKGVDFWPMALRSFSSILLHEQLVNELLKEHITGASFHKISKIKGKILDELGSPPNYYIIEPHSFYEFVAPLDEFDILSCGCGAQQKVFGEFKKPFKLKEDLRKRTDIFSIKDVNYRSWICISRNVVNVFLKNNWQRQFWIGSSAFPGKTIENFTDSWYEDTESELEHLHPALEDLGTT